ncbi:MAG TPA: 3-oxoacyl-ACP synthase [Planctomycetaceae bacterium]|nr:3-oxoacyl-ACP synthase [Planctomycetaceae bacterium]
MSTSESNRPNVVVTGVGVFSPIGIGRETFEQGVLEGTSGIGVIDLPDVVKIPGCVGGEVSEFTLSAARKEYLKPQRKSIKVMCRDIQLGVASAIHALEDSGIDGDSIDRTRLGIDYGADQMFSHPDSLFRAAFRSSEMVQGESGTEADFQISRWGETGIGEMEPLWLLKYLPNMPACHIAIAVDARGPNNSLTLAEASGNLAVGEAHRILIRGSADIMIAGSTGSKLHPIKCLHASQWDDLADGEGDPSSWCRPFDANRTGQVIGEGACSLVLETETHARARGATILGSILGAGSSCVIDRAGRPDVQQALVNAARMALTEADLSPADVGHIHAHGLASRRLDVIEASAIGEVFGERASSVPVTAMKSALGNSGAGSGTLELAASLLALNHGAVPRTLNYSQPDSDCPLDVVHGELRPVSNTVVLNLSTTSNGQASAVLAAV